MDINDLVNRPAMYASEDGMGELMIGLICLVSVGVFRFAPGRDLLFVPQAIWVCSILALRWGTKKVKEITAARGGYVAFHEPGGGWVLKVVAFLGFLAFILVSEQFFRPPVAGALACSAIFSGAYVLPGLKYRVPPHMLGLAAFSALLGGWAYVK